MNIKPIIQLPPFQVDASNETGEHQAGREDRPRKKGATTKGAPTKPPSAAATDAVAPPELPQSQVGDTDTVVELLSHIPSPHSIPYPKPPSSQPTELPQAITHSKINKVL